MRVADEPAAAPEPVHEAAVSAAVGIAVPAALVFPLSHLVQALEAYQ